MYIELNEQTTTSTIRFRVKRYRFEQQITEQTHKSTHSSSKFLVESNQFAGEDLRGQAQSLRRGEAHVVEGVAAAPPALGALRALRFGRHVAAIRDLILTRPDPIRRSITRAVEGC